jgi:hypothetical protein
MINPDEPERAVAAVDGFVQRWEARIGFGAATSDLIYAVTVHGFDGDAELCASDLRLILAANRKMRELTGKLLANLDALDDYMKQPERGGWGVECAVCMNEWLEPEDRAVMEEARSALSTKEQPDV